MKCYQSQYGYLLLQCLMALCCVSIALTVLLKVHVHSLYTQKNIRAEAWTLIYVESARHIQHYPSHDINNVWQKELESVLPSPLVQMNWFPEGTMKICWEEIHCWILE